MPFLSHIELAKSFEYTGAFDLSEVIDHIKSWFARNGYDVNEKEYSEKKHDPKSHKIKLECTKEIDDYHQYIMRLSLEITDFKEVEKNKKKFAEGTIKINLDSADVKRDTEEKWQSSTSKVFARAVYDKFVMEDKESEINIKLKKEVESLFTEIKQYFS